MLIRHYTAPNHTDVIELEGGLERNHATEAKQLITRIAHAHRGRLVIDLSQVSYMDVVGLSIFIEIRHIVMEAKGRMVLACASKDVQALIELTRLYLVFELFQTKEAAVRAMTGAPSDDEDRDPQPVEVYRTRLHDAAVPSTPKVGQPPWDDHRPGFLSWLWNGVVNFKHQDILTPADAKR